VVVVFDGAAEGAGSGEGGGDVEEFFAGEDPLEFGAGEGVADVADAVKVEGLLGLFEGVDFFGLG
jgi:hypothetical protein